MARKHGAVLEAVIDDAVVPAAVADADEFRDGVGAETIDEIEPGVGGDGVAFSRSHGGDEEDVAGLGEPPSGQGGERRRGHARLAEVGVERDDADAVGIDGVAAGGGDGDEVCAAGSRDGEVGVGVGENPEPPGNEVPRQVLDAVLRGDDGDEVVDERDVADAEAGAGVAQAKKMVLQPPGGAEIDERRAMRER